MIKATSNGIAVGLENLKWTSSESDWLDDVLNTLSLEVIREMSDAFVMMTSKNPDLELARRLQKKFPQLDIVIDEKSAKTTELEDVEDGLVV